MQEITWDQIEQALRDKEILICVEDRTIVCQRKEKIYLYNEKWHSFMNYADFYSLYANQHFVLYEKDEDFIDEKKDEEYYQWREKYQ